VAFAEWLSCLDEKSLALQVILAESAVKALAVVVVVKGLHPAVTCFDGESARHALRREQFVPICFAVG